MSSAELFISLCCSDILNLGVQETWVRPLGWEDPLEKEMATPLQYSCLENPMRREAWRATSMGSQELNMTEQLNHHHHLTTGKNHSFD